MISSGLEAILVKVAGIGLGEKQVGKTLGQLLPLLTKLVSLCNGLSADLSKCSTAHIQLVREESMKP